MLHTYRLREVDEPFIDSGRIDPVSQQPFAAGDEIVVCAECRCAFHLNTWTSLAHSCAACKSKHGTTLIIDSTESIMQPDHIKLPLIHAPPPVVIPATVGRAAPPLYISTATRFRRNMRRFHMGVWAGIAAVLIFVGLQTDFTPFAHRLAHLEAISEYRLQYLQLRAEHLAPNLQKSSPSKIGRQFALAGVRLQRNWAIASEIIEDVGMRLHRLAGAKWNILSAQWMAGMQYMEHLLEELGTAVNLT